MIISYILKSCWLFCGLIAIYSNAHASHKNAINPKNQPTPLLIAADTASYNQDSGATTFMHNVIVHYGNDDHLTAEQVTLHASSNSFITEVLAEDPLHLVHYWSTANNAHLDALAAIMSFDPSTSELTLRDQVSVKDLNHTFNGELMYYNLRRHHMLVPYHNKHSAVMLTTTNQ